MQVAFVNLSPPMYEGLGLTSQPRGDRPRGSRYFPISASLRLCVKNNKPHLSGTSGGWRAVLFRIPVTIRVAKFPAELVKAHFQRGDSTCIGRV